MSRRFSSPAGLAALATTLLVAGGAAAHGHGGHHGGAYHGGYAHAGHYHGGYGGFAPYYGRGFYPFYGGGFYRPYYGYGLGGLGVIGLGIGAGGGGYGLGGYGSYLPYYGGYGLGAPVVVDNSLSVPVQPASPPPAQTPPPPDNAAHLQLVVPDTAQVFFGGEQTNQTGPIREFVSPPLTPGKVFTYTIAVRYKAPDGQSINDRRLIHVRANDWFRIDFTRPAPPERSPAPRPE
jgi:uncharacterized protein (TIGR03000 family)